MEKKNKKVTIGKTAIPLLLVVFVFLVVGYFRGVSAQLLDWEMRLNDFITKGGQANIYIGEDEDGDQQVFIDWDGRVETLTDTRNAKGDLDWDGASVVWIEQVDGFWQVFLYNVISKTKLQLSGYGNNSSPKVDRGRVVWEGWDWDSGNWQIFLYNGQGVVQLTSGEMSMNPDIEGGYVVYGRKSGSGVWRSEGYSISSQKYQPIDIGDDHQYPALDNGEIHLGAYDYSITYPLKIDDLFVLDLAFENATQSSEITLEQILSELGIDVTETLATDSATATNSATQ